jgi:uncharacterized SAM-binding protein YcdF (DUF218 family)
VTTPKPGERWLLITSAYHMPRTIGLFRQACFGAIHSSCALRALTPLPMFHEISFDKVMRPKVQKWPETRLSDEWRDIRFRG